MVNRITGSDPFSLSPMLSLLPVGGNLSKLESFTSSLFARYEKVMSLLESEQISSGTESHQRLIAEQNMLKQVLDWLNVRTEN